MTDWTTRVECAFTTAPTDPSPVWEDITGYVMPVGSPVRITRGRADEFSEVSPGTCDFELLNSDGRFTPGNASSPYYPDVKKGRRLRVGVQYGSGNLLPANAASMETDISWWVGTGTVPPTLSSSVVRAFDGAKSLLITWGTGGTSPAASTTVTGMVSGQPHTASAYVWVPTGSPDVCIVATDGVTSFVGASTSTKDAWVRIYAQFTALTTSGAFSVRAATAPTAGQQCWVDAAQVDVGTTPPTFTTADPPIYYRFDGYVDQWPQRWPGGVDTYAVASVSCSDRLKRLGRIGNLRSVLEQEILSDAPDYYYTLGEPTDAVSAGNTSLVTQPALEQVQLSVGGTIEFGAGTGPGTDEMSAPVFTPASVTAGKYLAAISSRNMGDFSLAGMSIRAAFVTSTAADQIVHSLEDAYGNRMELSISAAGKLVGSYIEVFFGTKVAITSAATVSDGATHDGIFSLSVSAGTVSAELILDGASAGTGSFSSTIVPYSLRLVRVGGRTGGRLFTGTISHVAGFPVDITVARAADHRTAGTTGFVGDSSDERVARLATYAGIDPADVIADAGDSTSLVAQATDGQSPLALMQAVAATESGLLFMDTENHLTFHSRSRRFNADPVMTLSADSGRDISTDIGFMLDDQFKVNDLTVTRPGGATTRVVSQASIDDDDRYVDSLEVLTTSDLEAADVGYWRVNQYGDAAPRCPSVGLMLHAQASTTGFSDIFVDEFVGDSVPYTVVNTDIGVKIRLADLPANAPATTVDLFVEGYTESIGTHTWTIDYNTSPVEGAATIFRLDDPVYSLLDSGNRLAY